MFLQFPCSMGPTLPLLQFAGGPLGSWGPSSGVTRGVSQGGQSLAEVGPLVTVGGPLAKTHKKVKK